jgi:hypothetical protein
MSRKKAPVDPLSRQVVDAAWIRQRYGVSPRFIDRRIADGSLKPFKLGNHINRFYADEVVAYFERDRQ